MNGFFSGEVLIQFLSQLDYAQMLALLAGAGTHFLSLVLQDKISATARKFFVVAFMGMVFLYVIVTVVIKPGVSEAVFITTLIAWGAFVYFFTVELLKTGIGFSLSTKADKTQGENRWIRRLEYPCLFLGIIGLILTVHRTIAGSNVTMDLIGPLVLVTAASVKFTKTRAEVGNWQNNTQEQWANTY